jgi:UDP-N-acetylmuramate--alanine ligase
MSGLAAVLHARGAAVSGCDRFESPALASLRAAGVSCAVPHDPAHLDGVSEVVVSTAIDADEPELARARTLGLPVRHRSEVLASVLGAHGRRVVVTGAHGKTTTVRHAGRRGHAGRARPGLPGRRPVPQLGANWGAGAGSLVIAEGDESTARWRDCPSTWR